MGLGGDTTRDRCWLRDMWTGVGLGASTWHHTLQNVGPLGGSGQCLLCRTTAPGGPKQ